jgi:hypothetical protein
MKAIISRTYNSNETLGTLMVMEGERPMFQCKTIELPDNGNQHNTSCIPEGEYKVMKVKRPNGDDAFLIIDVPNRSNILIHKGNYAAGNHVDTLGCILPGKYFADINNDGNLDVVESTATMKELLELLPDKFKIHIL